MSVHPTVQDDVNSAVANMASMPCAQRIELGARLLKEHGFFEQGWVPETLFVAALVTVGALRHECARITRSAPKETAKQWSAILKSNFKRGAREGLNLLREAPGRLRQGCWRDKGVPGSTIDTESFVMANQDTIFAAGSLRAEALSTAISAAYQAAGGIAISRAGSPTAEALSTSTSPCTAPQQPPTAAAQTESSSTIAAGASRKRQRRRSVGTADVAVQAGGGAVETVVLGRRNKKMMERLARKKLQKIEEEGDLLAYAGTLRAELAAVRRNHTLYRSAVLAERKRRWADVKDFDLMQRAGRKLMAAGRSNYLAKLAEKIDDGGLAVTGPGSFPSDMVGNIAANAWREGKAKHGTRILPAIQLGFESLARSRSKTTVCNVLGNNLATGSNRTRRRNTVKRRLPGSEKDSGVRMEAVLTRFRMLADEHAVPMKAARTLGLGDTPQARPVRCLMGGIPGGDLVAHAREWRALFKCVRNGTSVTSVVTVRRQQWGRSHQLLAWAKMAELKVGKAVKEAVGECVQLMSASVLAAFEQHLDF